MRTPTALTGTAALASWAAAQGVVELEPALSETVTVRLLDYAANVAGGSDRRAVRTLGAYAASAPGDVPLPGGGTTSAELAPLVWGAASHVLESDDTHQPSSTHPGAVVWSAVLLAGAEFGASRDELARAAVVGYEVMCRLGETSGPINEYSRGFHPTGTCGVFGAATAVGVLLGLDAQTLQSALGIAASFSSGSMSFLTNGAWTKLLHPGNAARQGVLAARLAALGYKGPADPLSRPHGYFAGHAPQDAADVNAPAEGDVLAIQATSIKAHGCCRYEQGPIDAVLALRRDIGFGPDDIAAVRIGVLAGGWDIVAEPIEAKRRPASVVDSQFSMPFGAALALVRGSASPADHTDAALHDEQILRVADLVECRTDPSLDSEYPRTWPASVEIELRDGSTHALRIDYPKGDPENPFTREELAARVRSFAPWAEAAAVESVAFACITGNATAIVDAIAACFAPHREEEQE